MANWMKKGLVCGLLIMAVAIFAIGCAQQEAPAPAPEQPTMEEPSTDSMSGETTEGEGMEAPAEDTTMAPASE